MKPFVFTVYKVRTWEAIGAKIQQTLQRHPQNLLIVGFEPFGSENCIVPNELHKGVAGYVFFVGDKDTFDKELLYWEEKLKLSSLQDPELTLRPMHRPDQGPVPLPGLANILPE